MGAIPDVISQTDWETLREMLLGRSVRTGDFTLVSGRKSDLFIDVKQVALHPDGHRRIGAAFGRLVELSNLQKAAMGVRALDGVAGVALGGCSLAASTVSWVADSSTCPPPSIVYVRKQAKDHGTKKLVEAPDGLGSPVTNQASLVLVEDVITTGGSSIRAIEALREEGYEVEHVYAVIDREEGGLFNIFAQTGVQTTALFTRTELIG